jgi:hypothetical protein
MVQAKARHWYTTGACTAPTFCHDCCRQTEANLQTNIS